MRQHAATRSFFFWTINIFFGILILMENNNFANQPVKPPPPFNLPGEIKPPILPPQDAKSVKMVKKVNSKNIFLYIILFIIGLALTKYAFDLFIPKQPKSSVSAPQSSAAKLVQQANPPLWTEQKENQSVVDVKKKIAKVITPFILSGIFFSGSQSYCIINDKVLAKGDLLENAQVIRIYPEEVELLVNDKPLKINLRGK